MITNKPPRKTVNDDDKNIIIVHPADDHVVGTLLIVAAKHKEGAVILLGKELELGGVLKGSDVVLLVVGNRVWFLKIAT